MFEKTKEKLNIRFKFNDAINEEKSDEILFRVFDILLNSQKKGGQKRLNKTEENNENNRNTNIADKG